MDINPRHLTNPNWFKFWKLRFDNLVRGARSFAIDFFHILYQQLRKYNDFLRNEYRDVIDSSRGIFAVGLAFLILSAKIFTQCAEVIGAQFGMSPFAIA